jgi:hypothetical protein
MTARRRRRLVLAALVLLLTVLLVVLLYGVMREALAPWLARVYGTLRTYYRMIPQPVVWMVCVGLGVMVAVKSLLLSQRWSLGGRRRPANRGRVQEIRFWIHQATTEVYYDRRLARHLGKLALEIQSYTSGQKVSAGSTRRRLESLDLPPHVREYLKSGLEPMTTGQPEPSGLSWLFRFLQPPEAQPAPDTDLDEILRLLENQLEVRHDVD